MASRNTSIVDPAADYAKKVTAKKPKGVYVAGPIVRDACKRHLADLKNQHLHGIYYDKDEALKAVRYFKNVLRLAAGEFEGKPFILNEWESFVICSLFGWRRAAWKGKKLISKSGRRFGTGYIETGKGPLALDTPIPTPNGWAMMGELRPGDYVFDDHGTPTKIIATSPVFYNRECFLLTFGDGTQIIADADHRWNTAALRNGMKPGPRKDDNRRGGYAKRTTAEISSTYRMPPTTSKHPQAKWNHRVDVPPPLKLPDILLPIQPYTLGAWLGDGDGDCARITCADDEIMQNIFQDGYRLGGKQYQAGNAAFRQSFGIVDESRCCRGHDRITHARGSHCRTCENERDRCKRNNKPISPRVNISMNEVLRDMGLLNEKFIPDIYFRSGTQQRHALLQGLMDTDGSAAVGGKCEITLCNERLSRDVLTLIRTLGFKAVIRESDAKLNGRVVGSRWRIGFQAYKDFSPFRLSRKRARLADKPVTRALSCGKMIIGCDPIKSVPVRCITVEAESHMFLAGYGLVPTCNSGKSPLAAGIGLKMLASDGENRAEVYAVATQRDQAMVIFRNAIAMYQQSPELSKRLRSTGAMGREWNLYYQEKGSFFRPIATENTGKGKSGPIPHCNIFDEVHEHPTNAMIEFMSAGKKFRSQPLDFMITNSGFDKKSVCYEYHEYGRKVCAGEIEDDSFFAYICALDEGEDPFLDEKCWIKVNPSLPEIPGYDYLRKRVNAAKGMPSKESLVRRLNFCEWVGAENPAFSKEAWESCQSEISLSEFTGPCVAAIDLSTKIDLTSLTIEFINATSKTAFNIYWTPKDTLPEREKKDKAPYLKWVQQGYLNAVPGRSLDYAFIAHKIREINEETPIMILAFDRWRIDDLIRALDDAGVECYLAKVQVDDEDGTEKIVPNDPKQYANGIAMLGFGQGFRDMGPAVDDMEADLVDQKIAIAHNPVTTMCAANSVIVQDPAGGRKLSKQKATGRIDGMVSLLMANRIARFLDGMETGSVYDTQDILVI